MPTNTVRLVQAGTLDVQGHTKRDCRLQWDLPPPVVLTVLTQRIRIRLWLASHTKSILIRWVRENMNTVEHIVEAYFRICERCFTMHDVKVPGGNNRQFDLLAVSILTNRQYHVETSVMPGFCPKATDLKELFDKKFRGLPERSDNPKGDHAKGKTYSKPIENAYHSVGVDPVRVNRVWVTWEVRDPENLESLLSVYEKENGIRVEVISLCDVIIPKLQEKVATANYDDEVLRTLSLLKQTKQKEIQTQQPASGNAAGPRA